MKFFLALFFLLGFYIHNANSSSQYSIQYIDTNNGLSQNEVTSIIQDKYGFMWFGTRGGLNRYDGYSFKHFKPDAAPQSLSNPSVERLYKDNDGNIWIGTKSGGYSVYDISEQRFYTHKSEKNQPNRIVSFQQDDVSSMWIGGWIGGLLEYNSETDSVKHWLGNSRVNSMVQTPDGTLWCATNEGFQYKKIDNRFKTHQVRKGYNEITELIIDQKQEHYLWFVGWDLSLNRFNYKDFTLTRYPLPWDKNSLTPKAYSLLQDRDGDLWIGTWGDGLFRFDVNTLQFEQVDLKPKSISDTTIDYDVILDIYQDREGDLWIGTDGGGVVRLSAKSQFNTLGTSILNAPQERHVNTVCFDSQQRLWIGTKGSGVYVSETDEQLQKVEFLTSDRLYGKEGLIVKYISEDVDNNIWVSLIEGLYLVKKHPNGSYYMVKAARVLTSPGLRDVKKALSILFDHDDLWIATQQSGLFHFRKDSTRFNLVKQYIASGEIGHLPVNRITSLLHDKDKSMWVGTYKGLFKKGANDTTFVALESMLQNGQKPICDIILNLWIDDNTVWFGTPCGLNKLTNNEDGTCHLKSYTRADGLSDDYINGILGDDQGDLWLSTNAGLSRFDPAGETFRNYDETDGVGDSNFSESACYKGTDGTLYFGGFSDLTFFRPDEIKDNKTTPSIVFTDFRILNKEVQIEENGILTSSVNEVKEIELTYKESEFSFEIAALDFKAPGRNQYAYWLEGSGEERVNIGTRRHISFSNVKPGDYTLHLYGTNSNGVWSEQVRSLDIKVLPAPWRTWYAVVIYVLLILLVVALITIITRKQERLVNAANMQKILREKEQTINEDKLRFFTNISHEIRTPLTLIMAPINELLRKDLTSVSPSVTSKKIQLVHQHTTRLYNLVNQLLEFRKIEAGKIKLQANNQNIVSFVADISKAFDELADSKNVNYKKHLKLNEPIIFFDSERLGVVINNLLSNAFKFAGEPGQVEVILAETSNQVSIEIKNNGKGIADTDIKHLFERFYQASGKRTVGSSGIGLALVKNYVELHKGRVEVTSEPGKITTFSVILPKGKQHLSEDELKQIDKSADQVVVSQPIPILPKTRSVNIGTKGSKIIIVEDNDEVRSYLTDLLSDEFEVLEAVDGIVAYDLIVEHKPQVVISDVMMPRMDGYELCQKIKSNDTIAHIPVVLLTAKGTPQDQLFGTRKGADLYLTKPFEPELLIERIKQLIANRNFLSHKYAKKVKLEPTDAVIQSDEAKILEKAIKVIEKNISDPHFDPDTLAKELAMSLSTFYRRIKKMTDKTPGEFIKSIRLKRAAQLLRETNLTVSEIIECVGYQDVKNFRKNFKQSYELTPTDYRKQSESDH